MRVELNNHLTWISTSGGEPLSVSAPEDVAAHLIHALDFNFPKLDGIVRAPFFATDGTLIDSPGYHAASRLYHNPPREFVLPEVPESPTDEDLQNAKSLIENDVFLDFPFNDGEGRGGDSSLCHAWALLLQPFVRNLIPASSWTISTLA